MAINKVVYGADTLVDLTEDTVTAEDVLNSKSFHTPDGVKRTGTASYPVTDVQVNGTSVMDGTVAKVEQPTAEAKTATDEFSTVNGGLLSECKVSLTPNQDLHGYPNPWVGGAGKNKLEFPYTESSKTVSGITYTVKDNGDIAVSGTATAVSYFTFNHARQLVGNGQYIFSKGTTDTVILGADRCQISDNAYINRYADNTSSPTTSEITISISDADNNYARFWISVKNGETVNTTIHPMVRLASVTDATFEPYSNICPISGHTQVEVENDGKNKLDISATEIGTAWNGQPNTARARLVIPCKPSTYYTLSMNGTNNISNIYINDTDIIPASGAGTEITSYPYTYYSRATSKYIVIAFSKTDISQADVDALKFQLEEGQSATAYVPYNGYKITVNLGGTYYSGTLDVVSGVFTPDTAEKTLDGSEGLSWQFSNNASYQSAYVNATSVLPNVQLKSGQPYISNVKYNYFKNIIYASDRVVGSAYIDNGWLNLIFESNKFATSADLNTFLSNNPLQINYPIATPTPIQLSPTMVKALVGENHLSAPLEGQEITESKYRELFTYDDIEPEAYKIARDTSVSIVEANAAYNSVKYSTGSHKVGKWVDGTDLIETTYIVNSGITFGGTYNYISLPSYYKVRDYKGFIARTTGALDGFIYGYQGMSGDDISTLDIRPSNIEFSVQSALQTNFEYVSITIQYTVDL